MLNLQATGTQNLVASGLGQRRLVRTLIQGNQAFLQPAVRFHRIGQAAPVQQALHPLVGGVEKDAQLVNVVGLGVLLQS
jgi:hypothetical protein